MIRTCVAAVVCGVMLTAVQAPALARDAATEATNKRVVLTFYEKGLNQKDAEGAIVYLGPRYIQHNPTAGDGVEGFRKFIAFLKEKFPNSRSEVKRVIAEDDHVVLHVHAVREPGTRGNAIIDIFRLENGKIVEHWDVIQPVPEQAANSNGMF
jgi:predicted SnoaL-like aldol condensation-catalyzing enzyme